MGSLRSSLGLFWAHSCSCPTDGCATPSCGVSSWVSLLSGDLRTAFQEESPKAQVLFEPLLASSLPMSHWPPQVTWSSPESIYYKGNTQEHGHWEIWFTGDHYCNTETLLLSDGPNGVLRVVFVPFVRQLPIHKAIKKRLLLNNSSFTMLLSYTSYTWSIFLLSSQPFLSNDCEGTLEN